MFQREITKEEVAELELIQYEGPIIVIDSQDSFDKEIDRIAMNPILGFDTETRPSFKKGKLLSHIPDTTLQYDPGMVAPRKSNWLSG